jgi:hypothetical protein
MGADFVRPGSKLPQTPTGRASQKGFAAQYPKIDLGNKKQFGQAVRNVQAVHDQTPPEVRQRGEEWYPRVHEAVAKGVKGTSTSPEHGAGIVAAISPQMDWSGRNLPALHSLHKLRKDDWAVIHHSASTGRRTPEADALLKGTPLAHAQDKGLVRAHRLMQGEDPRDVLPRATSPKTHSFFHNIAYPGEHTHVTIDYRAHDIAANKMYPAAYTGRGLDSAATKSGKPTRYEHMENVYRSAARGRDIALPHTLQAITWEAGKHIETSAPTASGKPRVKGVARKGQPYVSTSRRRAARG